MQMTLNVHEHVGFELVGYILISLNSETLPTQC